MIGILRKRQAMVYMLLYILVITVMISVMGELIDRGLSYGSRRIDMGRWQVLILTGLQLILLTSFPLILALLYAARRITLCNSIILFILFMLFPVGLISPVRWVAATLWYRLFTDLETFSIRVLFHRGLRDFFLARGNLFFFTHWAYVKLAVGCLAGVGLAAVIRRPLTIVKLWIKRLLFGAACGILCLLIILNSTGVLNAWQQRLSEKEWALNQGILIESNVDEESGEELGNYYIHLWIRGIFDYVSEFMRYVRPGSSWPVLMFTVLLLVICCRYCANATSLKATVQAMAIVAGIGGITMLLTPMSDEVYSVWLQSMDIMLSAYPPVKLLELAWYILQPIAMLAVAMLIRARPHKADGTGGSQEAIPIDS